GRARLPRRQPERPRQDRGQRLLGAAAARGAGVDAARLVGGAAGARTADARDVRRPRARREGRRPVRRRPLRAPGPRARGGPPRRRAVMRGAAAVTAVALAALALGGCGAATRTTTPTVPGPPPAFATSPAGGVGASVDFGASDAVTRALRRALPGEALALASVVNDAGRLVPV